jgi:hypothetical protein
VKWLPRRLVIGTFRRISGAEDEEKATSIVESMPYIAARRWGDREEEFLI